LEIKTKLKIALIAAMYALKKKSKYLDQ